MDSIRAFDIVTADGRLRHVTAAREQDLFWAVRGGGGNFGVVTALECDLYAVGDVYGGNLFYPIESAADVLRAYNDWAPKLPSEFTKNGAECRRPCRAGGGMRRRPQAESVIQLTPLLNCDTLVL